MVAELIADAFGNGLDIDRPKRFSGADASAVHAVKRLEAATRKEQQPRCGDEGATRACSFHMETACVACGRGDPPGAPRRAMRVHRTSGATKRAPARTQPEGPGAFASWVRRRARA